MGMQWVRLDCAFPRNHKVLALLADRDGHRAITAYVFGLAYAGEQGTNGWLPRESLPLIHARPADAKRLVEAHLWLEEAGGWVINGWDEFQPSTDEMKRRTDKARLAANTRWEKHRDRRNRNGHAPSNARSNAPSIAPSNANRD